MDAMKEMAAKNQMAWEAASEMRETVKSHEKMLMKVTHNLLDLKTRNIHGLC